MTSQNLETEAETAERLARRVDETADIIEQVRGNHHDADAYTKWKYQKPHAEAELELERFLRGCKDREVVKKYEVYLKRKGNS